MPLQSVLAVLSGMLVGFSLGLIGGGGSILAVPLLLYVVGVGDAHLAIGTSAVAVAANALINLLPHARAGHVRWAPAALFALVGSAGAALGSGLGKQVGGKHLLALFALLMIVIALLMQRPLPAPRNADAGTGQRFAAVSGTGLAAGALSGFFGIGGGFLIVPGLRLAARMSMIEAIGSSLLAVSAFGATTAVSYALSGLVAWGLAIQFIVGGLLGGYAGARVAQHLARDRSALNRLFGAALIAVAVYMLVRSIA